MIGPGAHCPRSEIKYQQKRTGGAVWTSSNSNVHKITLTFLPHTWGLKLIGHRKRPNWEWGKGHFSKWKWPFLHSRKSKNTSQMKCTPKKWEICTWKPPLHYVLWSNDEVVFSEILFFIILLFLGTWLDLIGMWECSVHHFSFFGSP